MDIADRVNTLDNLSEHVIPASDRAKEPVISVTIRTLRKKLRKAKRTLSLYSRSEISTNNAKVSRPSSCPPDLDLIPSPSILSDPTITSLPPRTQSGPIFPPPSEAWESSDSCSPPTLNLPHIPPWGKVEIFLDRIPSDPDFADIPPPESTPSPPSEYPSYSPSSFEQSPSPSCDNSPSPSYPPSLVSSSSYKNPSLSKVLSSTPSHASPPPTFPFTSTLSPDPPSHPVNNLPLLILTILLSLLLSGVSPAFFPLLSILSFILNLPCPTFLPSLISYLGLLIYPLMSYIPPSFLLCADLLQWLFSFLKKRYKFIFRYIKYIFRYKKRKLYEGCLGDYLIVFNKYLRNGTFHFYNNPCQSKKSRVRTFLFRLYHRRAVSSSPLLNIKHIGRTHPSDNDRIPFTLNNSVPLVSPLLGSTPLPLLLDTGSPVNIIPKSVLNHFETLNSFSCTRFSHNNTFSSHSNDPLNILEEGVELPLKFTQENGKDVFIFLPFYVENTVNSSGILGLNSIKTIEILSYPTPSNFFTLSKLQNPVSPSSPVLLQNFNGTGSINGINITPGIYSLELRSQQSFHKESCSRVMHDPRITCSGKYNKLHKNFNIPQPSTFHVPNVPPVLVEIKNNKCIDLPIVSVENFGTLEFLAPLSSDVDTAPRIERPSNLDKKSTQTGTNIGYPPVEDLCKHFYEDNENLISQDINDVSLLQLNILSQEPKPLPLKSANIFFLNNSFSCFCGTKPCLCPIISDELSALTFPSPPTSCTIFSLPSQPLEPNNICLIIPPLSNLGSSALGSLLIKYLASQHIHTLLVHSPNLDIFTDFMATLNLYTPPSQTVLSIFNTIPPIKPPLPVHSEPPLHTHLHSVFIHGKELTHNRHADYSHSTRTIKSEILNQPEPFPGLFNNLETDTHSFLNRSSPDESTFLESLVNSFTTAVSLTPSDLGCIKNPDYSMDIELIDPSSPLPLDLPFPTSPNMKIASQKIVDNWIQSGIAIPSNTRTHGSRLTIAKKHLNPEDFDKIKNRLQTLNISIKEQSDLFRLNPSVLTDAELNKSYRQCLDARSLNLLTKDEFVCSPSSEQTLAELITIGSETLQMMDLPPPPSDMYPLLDPFLTPNDPSDTKLYMSLLDIKSAHNSLILTPRASDLLNCILPNYSTIRFVRSPFGLKNVNSTFNRVLTEILKDLINARLVLLYADDIILLSKGRVQHRRLLQTVFKLFADNGIKLSINKCSAFVDNYNFLGFTFGKSGISLTNERIRAIANLSPPHDLKSVQRFLGSIQYIARFLPDLQTILLPITPLLNKNTRFIWGPTQQFAFEKIKNLICTDPTLHFVDANKPLHLCCDASQYAGGGVLYQEDSATGARRPIAYFSRKFSADQSRLYSALELELINIIDNIGRTKCFTDLNKHPLFIVTDAKTILFLIKSQELGPNPKLSRLAARLINYDVKFKLVYQPPSNNPEFLLADFISRSYDPPDTDLKPIPMSSLRRITKNHIIHDLTPGLSYTYLDLVNLVKSNPSWFSNFPSPQPMNYNSHLFSSDPPYGESPSPSLPIDSSCPLRPLNPGSPEIVIKHINFAYPELTPDKIIPSQRADPSLSSLILDLETNFDENSPDENGFYILNKTLLKLKDPKSPPSPENSTLVLPESSLPNLISEFHILFGHLGVDRLSAILTSMYSAKLLTKYVKTLVLGCHQCQLSKFSTARLPPISLPPHPSFPLQVLSLDYFSVPPSEGFKFILIALDRFSGFIFVRKCKTEGAQEVISLLTSIFSTVGPALTLTSDNGSTLLRNRAVKTFLATWGVQSISLSLPYSPLHNARAERAIKAFRNLMRLFTDKHEHKWASLTEKITYMHNATPRLFKIDGKKLLVSPFQLFLRRPPPPSTH